MERIRFNDVTKQFRDGTVAVSKLNLEIARGEFVALLGPSGCGKTTALRMIAGLEDVTEGEILLGDRIVNGLEPAFRDVAMVFQNYALFPHMTAYENMAFPLRMRGHSRAEVKARVYQTARQLDLEDFLDRLPSRLSGGQCQRVAMGRAIVRNPAAFLMDEPLSNLDAKLRADLRGELAKLHTRLGITTVYVTHDQTEAMTLGSRVAVMRNGSVQQMGTPQEVYRRPENVFVAQFVGSPVMNLIQATLDVGGLRIKGVENGGSLESDDRRPEPGRPVLVGVRPEAWRTGAYDGQDGAVTVTGEVAVVEHLGAETIVQFRHSAQPASLVAEEGWSDTATFAARIDGTPRIRVGERLAFHVGTPDLHVFDAETGRAIAA